MALYFVSFEERANNCLGLNFIYSQNLFVLSYPIQFGNQQIAYSIFLCEKHLFFMGFQNTLFTVFTDDVMLLDVYKCPLKFSVGKLMFVLLLLLLQVLHTLFLAFSSCRLLAFLQLLLSPGWLSLMFQMATSLSC